MIFGYGESESLFCFCIINFSFFYYFCKCLNICCFEMLFIRKLIKMIGIDKDNLLNFL